MAQIGHRLQDSAEIERGKRRKQHQGDENRKSPKPNGASRSRLYYLVDAGVVIAVTDIGRRVTGLWFRHIGSCSFAPTLVAEGCVHLPDEQFRGLPGGDYACRRGETNRISFVELGRPELHLPAGDE